MPRPTVTLTHDVERGLGINIQNCTEAAAEMLVMAALAEISRRMLVKAILKSDEQGIIGARTLPPYPPRGAS